MDNQVFSETISAHEKPTGRDLMNIVTIGGYGFDEQRFIGALQNADVDVFVDIRQRRGLRGKQYAFLNSRRLQAILGDLGIRYVHLRELAPTQAVREVQRQDDADRGIGKRVRTRLSDDFVDAYHREVLYNFDIQVFSTAVGTDANVVALFCVEKLPEACHRSIVAALLNEKLGVAVTHIVP